MQHKIHAYKRQNRGRNTKSSRDDSGKPIIFAFWSILPLDEKDEDHNGGCEAQRQILEAGEPPCLSETSLTGYDTLFKTQLNLSPVFTEV